MVNFRTYCQYSLKYSIADLKKLVQKHKDAGDTNVAILDKDDIHSTIYLVKECKDAGLNPIIGYHHKYSNDITLWAKTSKGLRHLNIISTVLSKEFVTFDKLVTEDVVAIFNSIDAYEAHSSFFKESYLELNINEPVDTVKIDSIRKYAAAKGIKTIPTSSVLYVERAEAIGHDYFTNYIWKDDTHLESDDYYFKSNADFERYFTKEEIKNAEDLAKSINIDVKLGQLKLPVYDRTPNGISAYQHLENLCSTELKARNMSEKYVARLKKELLDVKNANLESYFLIEKEICDFARNNNISKGDGRGSGVGSLICFLLQITNCDPLEHGLLWERFYNAGRAGSLPDIDTDIEKERREEVISYISERFGSNKVFQIITYGSLGPKKAIKAGLSLAGCSFEEQNKVSNYVWHKAESIEEAIKHDKNLANEADRRKLLFNIIQQYEGAFESYGKHAAGIIIAKESYMDGELPMTWHVEDQKYISGYDLGAVDAFGLLKMDILGLNTLNIIKECSENIRKKYDAKFDIEKINLRDKAVYESIFHTGKTKGVFQLESQLGQKYSELVKPNSIGEIADLITIIRPGAMVPKQTELYLDVRNGKKVPSYPHPKLADILNDTYSACIYQESVIRICEQIAGLDLKTADSVRSAAGKKKKKLMDSMKSIFMDGCIKNDVKQEVIDLLWSWIVEFSGYSFNKSHAIGYAMCSYKTAYLKHYYPAEFLAASCNHALGDIHKSDFDEIKELVNDAKLFGIKFTPPNINKCNINFEVIDAKTVSYGLNRIKGIGEASSKQLMNMKNLGSYHDFLDNAINNSLKKNVVEALIYSGALDCYKITRNQMLAEWELIESLTDKEIVFLLDGLKKKLSVDKIVTELSDESNVEQRKKLNIVVPNVRRRLKIRELLHGYITKDKFESILHLALYERRYLGLAISVNEVDGVFDSISHECLEIKDLPANTKVNTIIHIEAIREIVTKNGKNPGQAMAFITGGDGSYTLDNIVVFPKVFEKYKDMIQTGAILKLIGVIGDSKGLIVNKIQSIR